MVRYAFSVLSESYLIVMAGALLVGLFFPPAKELSIWSTFLLQIIFFLFSLKIDWHALIAEKRSWLRILSATIVMLFLLPALVWLLTRWLPADFGLALFLLALMPAGMTTPLLVDLVIPSSVKRKASLRVFALILTVFTSLLAPFSIPLLLRVFYGASVSLDFFVLFWKLALVIFIPFIAAVAVRSFASRLVNKINPYTKPISILLLGFLIAGSVSAQAEAVRDMFSRPVTLILMLVGLILFYAFLHLIGYYVFWWRSKSERVVVSVSLTYLNFVLAIYLAVQFFPNASILVPLVLSIIPWALALPVWKRVVRRL